MHQRRQLPLLLRRSRARPLRCSTSPTPHGRSVWRDPRGELYQAAGDRPPRAPAPGLGHDAWAACRRGAEGACCGQRARRASVELDRGQARGGHSTRLTEFGHLLETFVVGEVSKQLDWLDEPVARGHWRTHDGDEVDLVLEREDGKIAALEVKAASRVTARELRSMLKLRGKLGSEFLGGVVLYTGARAYTHDGMQIVPVSRLGGRASTSLKTPPQQRSDRPIPGAARPVRLSCALLPDRLSRLLPRQSGSAPRSRYSWRLPARFSARSFSVRCWSEGPDSPGPFRSAPGRLRGSLLSTNSRKSPAVVASPSSAPWFANGA